MSEESDRGRDRPERFGIGPSKSGTIMWEAPDLEAADRKELRRRLHLGLHGLWSKAVGTPDYVKAEWMQFEKILYLLGVHKSSTDEHLPRIIYPEDVSDEH